MASSPSATSSPKRASSRLPAAYGVCQSPSGFQGALLRLGAPPPVVVVVSRVSPAKTVRAITAGPAPPSDCSLTISMGRPSGVSTKRPASLISNVWAPRSILSTISVPDSMRSGPTRSYWRMCPARLPAMRTTYQRSDASCAASPARARGAESATARATASSLIARQRPLRSPAEVVCAIVIAPCAALLPTCPACGVCNRVQAARAAVAPEAAILLPVIDTHCHLTFPELRGDVPGVMAEAASLGVGGAITISTTTRDCVEALAVARSHPRVWCSAGVHPLYSDQGPHDWDAMLAVARDPRCVAWGELGLDRHHAQPPLALQREVLEEQLGFIGACARGQRGPALDLPVVIHCRQAFAELIPVLRSSGLDPRKMVFHCFTGTQDEARAVLDLGAMLSFTGVVTYKNAAELRDVVRLVPDGRFMLETDAPFLSPEPRRSERPCRPAMVGHTAHAIAAARSVPLSAVIAQTDAAALGFFGPAIAPALGPAHAGGTGGAGGAGIGMGVVA
ncbi:MAG: hypothetical protein C0513_02565 [Isosphaera sp.]|nr:hypothetical protein [Isosphaera sp.]